MNMMKKVTLVQLNDNRYKVVALVNRLVPPIGHYLTKAEVQSTLLSCAGTTVIIKGSSKTV